MVSNKVESTAAITFLACFVPFAGNSFTDTELMQWLSQKEKSLILIVSDGMPYSQKSIPIVSQQAQERNLPLIILSDRTGAEQKKRGDCVVSSNVLIENGALRHFPSLFAVKDHQLLPEVIPGIQTPQELRAHLTEFYGDH